MNTKLALTAIAMFAVIMGVSAIAPAIAEPGNPRGKATTEICHYAEEETISIDTDDDGIPDTDITEPAHWEFLFVNGKGATNGHINKHSDGTQSDFEIVNDTTRALCQSLVDATATA